MTLDEARNLFPHTGQGRLYMNHAGTGPLSTRVVESVNSYLRERSAGRIDNYQYDLPMVAECKSMIARLINAGSPDRIALTANTSDALNIIAAGLRWRNGDRILVGREEFPANVWPYLNCRKHGVQVDFMEMQDGGVTPELIENQLRSSTRIVAISAVQYLSGYRADLASIADLCHRKGALCIVDGIQAVGAVRIDVKSTGIDALAAGGQKWQMAPHGNGFLYVTETLQEQLEPAYFGWLAAENPWHFNDFEQPPAGTARRFEGGSLNMPGLWGYHAALSTLVEFGPEAIEDRLGILTDLLAREFAKIADLRVATPTDPRLRAGIVTIAPDRPHDTEVVFKRMLRRNTTAALRMGMIRFSPHFYMKEEEMSLAATIVRECLTGETE
jgi:selenocysteine lyase/cysteine desulfurase